MNHRKLVSIAQHSQDAVDPVQQRHVSEMIMSLIQAGTLFREFHFVMPEAERARKGSMGVALPPNVRLVDIHDLPKVAPDYADALLLTGGLAVGAYIRRCWTRHAVPVVWPCPAPSFIADGLHTFRGLLSDVRSYDCVLARNPVHLKAIREQYMSIAERCAPLLEGIDGARFPRFETLPLGIDTETFRPTDAAAARQPLDLPRDVTVLFVPSVIPHSWVEAFLRVLGSRSDVLLLVVGKGAAGPGIRSLSQERIREGYAAADVAVLPEETGAEIGSLRAMEALSCQVPVVASGGDGLRGVMTDGETGFLVSGEADVFFRRAIELADRPDLRRMMGAEGRRRMVQGLDWRRLIPRYEALFRSLLEEASTTAAPLENGRRGLDFFRPRYFDVFESYPTSSLDDETAFRLTPDGRRVAAGEARLPVYGAMLAVLREDKLRALFAIAEEPRLVRDLRQALALDPEETAFHVLWLTKHGYLEPVPCGSTARNVDASTTSLERPTDGPGGVRTPSAPAVPTTIAPRGCPPPA